jgi:hypothetical protein
MYHIMHWQTGHLYEADSFVRATNPSQLMSQGERERERERRERDEAKG